MAQPGFPRRAALAGVLTLAGVIGSGRARAADRVLRIGVQKYGTLIVLRDTRRLDPVLAALGWQARWTEFPGGPQLLEALNVGDLDFGTAGEAPPIFALAAGAPLVYAGVEPPAPAGEAILVPAASPIRTLVDLRGKRVALNKGSNVHFLLVQALAKAGLRPTDIEPVYLVPADARAAFEAGSVDAWAIWDPFLAAGQAATNARTLTDGRGLAPNRQYFLAARDFAERHADIMRVLLDAMAACDSWTVAHQDEVAAMLAPRLGLPLPVMRTALGRMSFGAAPMTAEAADEQQRIADTFYALKLIPVPVDVRKALWSPKA
jgi:sulfonate transport system substrate-binding protein